jgi:hypothetical protein
VGEYTGRRRGRPASEPQPEQPQYAEAPVYEQYAETPVYEYEDGYGYQQPAEYASGGYPSAEYPSYEYGYEAPQYYVEPEPYAPEPQQPHSRRGQPSPEETPYAPEYGYTEQYAGEYYEQYYEQYTEEYVQEYAEDYAEEYVEQPYLDSYAEPRFESRRRSSNDVPHEPYEPYEYVPETSRPHRQALPLLAHLPFLGASTAALVITSFISVKAVAAVVLPLQLLVAWAILDLAGHASRRTAVLLALPTLTATLGTFKFQADESATAVAGGLGVGFSLLAADAVFRAGRRGVEPGTVRALAAAASALLFAGLTGMFLPAARLDTGSVAIGAAVGALVGLVAARNPELGSSRVVVVAVPATAAALASYAAAILVT